MSSHLMKIITADKDLFMMSPKQSFYEHPIGCKAMSVNPTDSYNVIKSLDSRLVEPSCTEYSPEANNRKNNHCWDLNNLTDALDSCIVSSPGDHERNLIVSMKSSTEYSPGYVKSTNILKYNPIVINTSNENSPGFVDTSDIPEYNPTKSASNTSTEDSHGSMDSTDIPEYCPGFVNTPDIPEYIPTKIKHNASTLDTPGSTDSPDIPLYNSTKNENDNCECSMSTAEFDNNGGICLACTSILSKLKKRRNCHRSCPITSSCSHESYHSNPPKRNCIHSEEPSYV